MVARNLSRQNDLATLLCREANVECWRPLTICDLSKFEDILSVDILVISLRLGNKFIRVPSDEESSKQRLYLYLVEYETTYHFHVISNISAFSSGSRFCRKTRSISVLSAVFVCKRTENCLAVDDENEL